MNLMNFLYKSFKSWNQELIKTILEWSEKLGPLSPQSTTPLIKPKIAVYLLVSILVPYFLLKL